MKALFKSKSKNLLFERIISYFEEVGTPLNKNKKKVLHLEVYDLIVESIHKLDLAKVRAKLKDQIKDQAKVSKYQESRYYIQNVNLNVDIMLKNEKVWGNCYIESGTHYYKSIKDIMDTFVECDILPYLIINCVFKYKNITIRDLY